MSHRNYLSREGSRRHTDPTSRFYTNSKYRQRGRGNNRPVPNRRQTGGDDLDRITVSIGRHLTTNSLGPSFRERLVNRSQGPQQIDSSNRMTGRNSNQTRWWRVSIPQAGSIGKERVMSTLRAHCIRQFQPYHVN